MTAFFRRIIELFGILSLMAHASVYAAEKRSDSTENPIRSQSQQSITVRDDSFATDPTMGVQIEFIKWRISFSFDGAHLVPTRRYLWDLPNKSFDGRPQITLAQGRLRVSGCPGLQGTYQLHADRLKISAISSPLAGFCPQEQMRLNNQILHTLNGERNIVRDGHDILLKDMNGNIQAALSR